ncbi:MAG: heme exporter protein CcmB [Parvularculaceae bacterium]|nr:heme exporter protein CcmB [Parvularculaceae bacterium]
MKKMLAIFERDIALAFRAGGGAINSVVFLALTVLIFALAVGPDRARLAASAAPILWTAATLAAMLSFDSIFQADFEDGSLDVLAEATESLGFVAVSKAAAHWVSALLPLILATPPLAVLLGLPAAAYFPLVISLAVATPALSLLGVLASALALSLRRASILMTILTAPLLTPAVIFGVAAANAGAENSPLFGPLLMLLAAFTLLFLIAMPLAAGAALRFNID